MRRLAAFTTGLLAASVCLCATGARADLVVSQAVEGGAMSGEMKIKIKGTKARADLAQPISMIVDSATGESIVLQTQPKIFSKVSKEDSLAMADQVLAAQGQSAPPKLEPGTETRQIAGHNAKLYTWTVGAMKIRFFVATDFPNAASIQQQLDVLQNGGLASVAAKMMPRPADMPGVRMRTEMDLGGQKVNYTITSIEEKAVDAAEFEVPKGYREMPMPATPGAEKK